MSKGVDLGRRSVVEGDLLAIRRPVERADMEVALGEPAGLRAVPDFGHPEVRHAEVGVFDGVVAVAFLALFETVGSRVGGRERDLGAVR